MKALDIQKMQTIEGGGLKWGILGGIAAIITFLAGIFDGYTNPSKCNN